MKLLFTIVNVDANDVDIIRYSYNLNNPSPCMPVTKNVLIEHTLMFKMFKDDMHSYVATVYAYGSYFS